MYNRDFRQEYYNYVNNNYNQPIYTENSNPNKLYDPYQGFIRGNLYQSLYNGYKVNPIELTKKIIPMFPLMSLQHLQWCTLSSNLLRD